MMLHLVRPGESNSAAWARRTGLDNSSVGRPDGCVLEDHEVGCVPVERRDDQEPAALRTRDEGAGVHLTFLWSLTPRALPALSRGFPRIEL